MRRSMCVQLFESELLFLLIAHGGAVAHAQVETIDPNPTLPHDVGGNITFVPA